MLIRHDKTLFDCKYAHQSLRFHTEQDALNTCILRKSFTFFSVGKKKKWFLKLDKIIILKNATVQWPYALT